MNGFLTGDFLAASAQALQATLFGVGIAALRLRLNSLWPVIVVHSLWDLCVFLMTASVATGAAESAMQAPTVTTFLAPTLFQLPLFLYGLWLLRGLRDQPPV